MTRYCEKCKRTMDEKQFYQSNNLEKYPNGGKMNICKKCMTMHVDNWDPDTYLWILQEVDVPYVPDEWMKLLSKYGADPSKLTGLTIIGRYLSKMKLKQFKDYRWKDTEFLKELNKTKTKQTMEDQGYDVQEIEKALQAQEFAVPAGEIPMPEYNDDEVQTNSLGPVGSLAEIGSFPESADASDDFDSDLTDEDKLYLRLKWGKTYKPEEWIKLEKLYNEMCESYDIQTAGHIDTLKLVCKTSLKANQLIDVNDIEGFQKMSKVYDSLMKSGKFTAAQNKATEGDAVDSISEIVAMCEKDGFIPRFYNPEPNDYVDRTLQDMQSYTRSLVMDEMNLGNLIENAVKQIERDKEREADAEAEAASDDELLEKELFEDKDSFMKDEDFQALWDLEEELAADDAEATNPK